MTVDDFIAEAWGAVDKAEVPEHLQAQALEAAFDFLRQLVPGSTPPPPALPTDPEKPADEAKQDGHGTPVTADVFYDTLASESGVDRQDLEQLLHLTPEGIVEVLLPTRMLGANGAEQARAVIALVGGARHAGLGESPVSRQVIADECSRKKCYQRNNFATKHVGRMAGFNLSGANVIVNSRWVDEFAQAAARALGRDNADS